MHPYRIPGSASLVAPGQSGPRSQGSAIREVLETAGVAMVASIAFFLWIGHEPRLAWRDDFQTFFMPMLTDIGRAWRSGEVPLLSEYSWFGGALAAEYTLGFISPVVAALSILASTIPMRPATTALLLTMVHLLVATAGGYRLLRARGVRPAYAAAFAWVMTLNGFVITWAATNWFSMLLALPWMLWLWWALEAEFESPVARPICVAVFSFLLVGAGAPYLVLMGMLLTGWHLLRLLEGPRDWTRVATVLGGWFVGASTAAAGPLMLQAYFASTLRAMWKGGGDGWTPPFSSLLGLLLPSHTTRWETFDFPLVHTAVEMSGAFLPLVGLAAGSVLAPKVFFRKVRLDLFLLAVAMTLLLSGGFGPFRWSFRWLLFLHPLLAMLGAIGLEAIDASFASEIGGRKARLRQAMPLLGAALIALAWPAVAASGHLETGSTAIASACLALMFLWFLAERFVPRLGDAFPSVIVLALLSVSYAALPISQAVPTWDPEAVGRPLAELDPEVTYLSVYTRDDIVSGWGTEWPVGRGESLLPGNTAMLARAHLINGYSPMEPAGLSLLLGMRMQGFMIESHARHLLARETGEGGVFEQLGVGGLILARRFWGETSHLERHGWRRTAADSEAALYMRREPRFDAVFAPRRGFSARSEQDLWVFLMNRPVDKPGVGIVEQNRLGPGASVEWLPAKVGLVTKDRTRVSARVEVPLRKGVALVVFRRPWFPGARAELDGREVPIRLVNLAMPAVELPGGSSGEVVLRYRPEGLMPGVLVGLVALVAGVFALMVLARLGSGRSRLRLRFPSGSRS